jgi:flavin-dependent dehydrogenase
VGRDFEVVAVGSGPAGHSAVSQAAKPGREVALLEPRRVPGGGCVNARTIRGLGGMLGHLLECVFEHPAPAEA